MCQILYFEPLFYMEQFHKHIKPVRKVSQKKTLAIVKHDNVSYIFLQVDLILYTFKSTTRYFIHFNKIQSIF